MLRIERHDDVTRVRLSTWRGRLVGYDVSVYLVRGILVDTGFPRAAKDFEEFLDATAIRGVIVTHWHEDHAGNAAIVAARRIPLAISAETRTQLAGPDAASIRFYRRFVWGIPSPVPACAPYFDTDGLQIIHTPGHTADHQVVWDAERETLFSGDLFLGVRVRATFPDENPRQLAATLRTVAGLSPKRMFDAHRGGVRDPTRALLAKAEWIEETVSRIDAKIEAGWSDRAIQHHVLGRERAVGVISQGEYSKRTFVRVVRRTRGG